MRTGVKLNSLRNFPLRPSLPASLSLFTNHLRAHSRFNHTDIRPAYTQIPHPTEERRDASNPTWLSQTFPPSLQPWVSPCAHCLSSNILRRVHATDLYVQLSKTRLLLPLRNRRRRANLHPPPTRAQSRRKPRAHLRPAHTSHSPLAVAVSIFAAPRLRRAAQ